MYVLKIEVKCDSTDLIIMQVDTTDTFAVLEMQVSVFKEQLSAEKEARRKIETELRIASNRLAQETERRELLERLVQAMHDKLKAAGIVFSLPSGLLTPPSPTHSPYDAPGDQQGSKFVIAAPTPVRPSPGILVSTGKLNPGERANTPQINFFLSSSTAAMPTLRTNNNSNSTTTTPPSPKSISFAKPPLAGSAPQFSRSTSPGGNASNSNSNNYTTRNLSPPAQLPSGTAVTNRPGRSGTSLIASAYQSSGRPIPTPDESDAGKSLTERLVAKMFSADQGLRLQEREGKRCFPGSECVDWLVEELRAGRDKAVVIADKLLSRNFFRNLAGGDPGACFTEENTYYVAERMEMSSTLVLDNSSDT